MRHGDARCAPARQGWAGAAPAENCCQRDDTGGPGVLRTPGRRPPHRNGGTFGSFSHERTTMQREVGKKMAAKLSRQLTYKTNSAKANKEKSSVSGTGGCGVSRGVSNAGRPASRFWQRGRRERVRGFPQRGRRERVRGFPQRGRRGRVRGFPQRGWRERARGCPQRERRRQAGCGRRPQKSPRKAGAWPGRKARG